MLEFARRAARAQIVPSELFDEMLVSVHDADTAFNPRLGLIASAPFAGAFEKRSALDLFFPFLYGLLL